MAATTKKQTPRPGAAGNTPPQAAAAARRMNVGDQVMVPALTEVPATITSINAQGIATVKTAKGLFPGQTPAEFTLPADQLRTPAG